MRRDTALTKQSPSGWAIQRRDWVKCQHPDCWTYVRPITDYGAPELPCQYCPEHGPGPECPCNRCDALFPRPPIPAGEPF